MRELIAALAVLASTVALGCASSDPAAASPTEDEIQEDADAEGDESAGEGDELEDWGGAWAKGEDDTGERDASDVPPPDAPPAAPPSRPEVEAPPPAPTPSAPRPAIYKETCSAGVDGHTSVATLSWEVTATGAAKVLSLSVLVTNEDRRNANDLDVWYTLPGGTERFGFNSGDVLSSGRSTAVPWPSTTVLKVGTTVKLVTHFDSPFADPADDCTIQL